MRPRSNKLRKKWSVFSLSYSLSRRHKLKNGTPRKTAEAKFEKEAYNFLYNSFKL